MYTRFAFQHVITHLTRKLVTYKKLVQKRTPKEMRRISLFFFDFASFPPPSNEVKQWHLVIQSFWVSQYQAKENKKNIILNWL